jgi:hypothetical protein
MLRVVHQPQRATWRQGVHFLVPNRVRRRTSRAAPVISPAGIGILQGNARVGTDAVGRENGPCRRRSPDLGTPLRTMTTPQYGSSSAGPVWPRTPGRIASPRILEERRSATRLGCPPRRTDAPRDRCRESTRASCRECSGNGRERPRATSQEEHRRPASEPGERSARPRLLDGRVDVHVGDHRLDVARARARCATLAHRARCGS